MRISIIGSGAMASLIGAGLQAVADNEVTLWGSWPEQIKTIKDDGLLLKFPDGQRRVKLDARFLPDPPTPADLVIVLVKSYRTAAAADWTVEKFEKKVPVLTLQNGIGNREILESAFGTKKVFAGTTASGARLLSPGVLQVAGIGKTVVGYGNGQKAQARTIAKVFEQAGFPCDISPQVNRIIWDKLLINIAINPLTAIHGVTNGELLSNPDLDKKKRAVIGEVVQAAGQLKIHISPGDPLEKVNHVCRATSGNRSSMLQDISNGRPTEIEAILGRLLHMTQDAGISMPICQQLYDQVKKIERRYLGDSIIYPNP